MGIRRFGEDIERTDKSNADIINVKFEDKLQNATIAPKAVFWPHVNGGGRKRDAKRDVVKEHNVFRNLYVAELNALHSKSSREDWADNMRREPALVSCVSDNISSLNN